ncbi:MAG: winged helix-turn-helix domain-containing protein, partial [Polyangiales bacterium]
MTFTEAAVEVLRSVGKPLHYKKITEIAIERNLLSHVGKTPETTMSSRLATMVKKDRGDAPILKVKPGVFALREFPEDVVDDLDEVESDSDAPEAMDLDVDVEEEEESTEDEVEPRIAAPDLPGSEVFPEEDDDDELILANLDGDTRDGRKPRKRRPRRRRERDNDNGPSAEARPERRPPLAQVPQNRPRREPPAPATRAAEAGEPLGRDLSDAIETALRNGSRQARSLNQVADALIGMG